MKFAAIIPPIGQGLRILERVGLGYHLCLAQELLRDRTYREYYRVLGKLGHFIIVDNGAAERDQPPFPEVVQAARYVYASEVVMPDVVLNSEATLDALLRSSVLDLVPPRKRFIVPQATTVEGWQACLMRIHKELDGRYATIGLSKYHHNVYTGGRAAVLAGIPRWLRERANVHVLGIATGDPYGELQTLFEADMGLRGVDTAAPVAYAQRSRQLPDPASTDEHISVDWDTPYDLDLARQNILSLAKFAARLIPPYNL